MNDKEQLNNPISSKVFSHGAVAMAECCYCPGSCWPHRLYSSQLVPLDLWLTAGVQTTLKFAGITHEQSLSTNKMPLVTSVLSPRIYFTQITSELFIAAPVLTFSHLIPSKTVSCFVSPLFSCISETSFSIIHSPATALGE